MRMFRRIAVLTTFSTATLAAPSGPGIGSNTHRDLCVKVSKGYRSDSAVREAEKHAKLCRELRGSGQHLLAIPECKRAYELDPDLRDILLYYIGDSYDVLGKNTGCEHLRAAVLCYEQYVDVAVRLLAGGVTSDYLKTIEEYRIIADDRIADLKSTCSTPPPPPHDDAPKISVGWSVVLGLGVAAVVAGGAIIVDGSFRWNGLQDTHKLKEWNDVVGRPDWGLAKQEWLAGGITAGVGVLAVAAGAAFIRPRRPSEKKTAWTLTPAPGGLLVSGRF